MSSYADLTRPAAPARLLVIADSAPDAMLYEEALREDDYLATALIDHASSFAAGIARLTVDRFDGIIVDVGQGGEESVKAVERLSDDEGHAAVVVLSARNDALLAEQAFGLGAQEFLVKSVMRPGDLRRAVDSAIRRQRVQHEREQERDATHAPRELLSHVSAELRSPLAVVDQFASLLLDDVAGPLSLDQREFLSVLTRNVTELTVMIDDLLQVTHADRGQVTVVLAPLTLEDLLTKALFAYGPAAERRGIALRVDAADLPTVIGDEKLLLEVLAKLLDNALKFTPDGGQITIEAAARGAKVRVTVRDTGRGVRPQDEDRIFEQFFQARDNCEQSRNGLGLGLYICRDLIRRHGGAIWASSQFGRGTSVAFTIPVLDDTQRHTDSPEQRTTERELGKKLPIGTQATPFYHR